MGLRWLRKMYLAARRVLLGTGISTVPPFSWIKQAALRRLRGPGRKPVLGSWMRLDPLDRLNLGVNGVYEPEDTAFAGRVIRSGNCVVDVGANVGYYTCYFSRLVGPKGRVLAFEPAPDMFEIASDNVRYNGYDTQTEVRNQAVTDHSGPLTLYMEEGRPEDNRIFNDGEAPRKAVAVEGVCLDDVEELKTRPPDFIKMDIQGAEIFAIRGMRRVLRESTNVCVLLEYWPYGLLKTGRQPEELIGELMDAGLVVCRVAEEDGRLVRVRKEDARELCGVGIGTYINLVAAHEKRMAELLLREGR